MTENKNSFTNISTEDLEAELRRRKAMEQAELRVMHRQQNLEANLMVPIDQFFDDIDSVVTSENAEVLKAEFMQITHRMLNEVWKSDSRTAASILE